MTDTRSKAFGIPGLPTGWKGMWRRDVPKGIRYWKSMEHIGDIDHSWVRSLDSSAVVPGNEVVLVRDDDLRPSPGWHRSTDHDPYLMFVDDGGRVTFTASLAATRWVPQPLGRRQVAYLKARDALLELAGDIPELDAAGYL